MEKMTVTFTDSDGNETVTECEPFREVYPGQIDEIVGMIENGCDAQTAAMICQHPQPKS